MFLRLGNFVSRYWLLVLTAWLIAIIVLRSVSPVWEEITEDGDFAYLPAGMPSVVGEELLSRGFPHNRAKSQIAFFAIRDAEPLDQEDWSVAYDLARRLKNLHAVAAYHQAEQGQIEGHAEETAAQRADREQMVAREWEKALDSLDEAIRIDDILAAYEEKRLEAAAAGEPGAPRKPAERLAELYFNRHLVQLQMGETEEAERDLRKALDLDESLATAGEQPLPREAAELPLLDVWTWLDDVFGAKLRTRQAAVVVLQLSNEFMATDNIRILNYLEEVLATVESRLPADREVPLQLGFSGSAAVGGDLLRAAQDSIQNTELFTVVLVVLILGLVYRSPLLILMPLITITCSLTVATSMVSLLTQVDRLPGFEWWTFKVFATTKIFIVVILFGAGTDYFLFLLARYKEELQRGHAASEAIARALAGVGDALAASALTTIVGLGTMFFADFGKFSNSGPAIALCLAVALLACITLAPALLRAFGTAVFWPWGTGEPAPEGETADGQPWEPSAPGRWFWEPMAAAIVRHPGLILVTCLLVLFPLARHGWHHGRNITYDFLRQLPVDRPSRQGAELMARHFDEGESGPIQVIAYHPEGAFDTREAREDIRELSNELYVDGVRAVRSISDPLGDFPPGAQVGLFRRKSWWKLVASPHPRTQELFVAQSGELAGRVTRLDLLLEHDPFSVEAAEVLERIEADLRELGADSDSPWYGTTFAFSGVTAGIRDLKLVTQSDNTRIQILVVLAVLAVLLAILRRPVLCVYMILTVLFSYFVTLGATEWFFGWAEGAEFRGLDWKVPLFLFVILVAIGQDNNVYLATRVFEEQRRRSPLEGLRWAVIRTGGVITSCGVIMAGTFSAMTSGDWGRLLPAWLPGVETLFGGSGYALPAIVQLGFALTLGVMLDTFVIRPIVVPAFLSLMCRWKRHPAEARQEQPPESSLANDAATHEPLAAAAELRPRTRCAAGSTQSTAKHE